MSVGVCMVCDDEMYVSPEDGHTNYCGCEDCHVCGQPFCDIYEDTCIVCDSVFCHSPEDGHTNHCGCGNCKHCGNWYSWDAESCNSEMTVYRAFRPDEPLTSGISLTIAMCCIQKILMRTSR